MNKVDMVIIQLLEVRRECSRIDHSLRSRLHRLQVEEAGLQRDEPTKQVDPEDYGRCEAVGRHH